MERIVADLPGWLHEPYVRAGLIFAGMVLTVFGAFYVAEVLRASSRSWKKALWRKSLGVLIGGCAFASIMGIGLGGGLHGGLSGFLLGLAVLVGVSLEPRRGTFLSQVLDMAASLLVVLPVFLLGDVVTRLIELALFSLWAVVNGMRLVAAPAIILFGGRWTPWKDRRWAGRALYSKRLDARARAPVMAALERGLKWGRSVTADAEFPEMLKEVTALGGRYDYFWYGLPTVYLAVFGLEVALGHFVAFGASDLRIVGVRLLIEFGMTIGFLFVLVSRLGRSSVSGLAVGLVSGLVASGASRPGSKLAYSVEQTVIIAILSFALAWIVGHLSRSALATVGVVALAIGLSLQSLPYFIGR